MKMTTNILGIEEWSGLEFDKQIEKIIAGEKRQLIFIFKNGTESTIIWERRKSIPYSVNKEKISNSTNVY